MYSLLQDRRSEHHLCSGDRGCNHISSVEVPAAVAGLVSVCGSPKAAFALVVGGCRDVKHTAAAAAAHSRGCSCGRGLRAVGGVAEGPGDQSAGQRVALKKTKKSLLAGVIRFLACKRVCPCGITHCLVGKRVVTGYEA